LLNDAHIIGSGPNGLAAAIVLAAAGLRVQVFEAQPEPGGAARTLPLTLPDFLHDFGSAVHPLAAASPFFSTLPLAAYGLEWIHSPAPLAHPLDDGSAVVLERDLTQTAHALGPDGPAWRHLLAPIVHRWPAIAEAALAPALPMPRHPLLMARFGLDAFSSAQSLARSHFSGLRARALFAGLAGHSFLDFSQPLSSAVGLILAAAAHAVGWPIPRGGARAIPDALITHLQSLGGQLHTGRRIDAEAFRALQPSGSSSSPAALNLFDTSPAQLLAIAGDRLPPRVRHAYARFRRGPAAFKIDFALSDPVPWRAPGCRRAATVHLGGTFEEIAASESAVAQGRAAERPFVLAAQPSLFDPSRAPAGRHVLWTYCHVPNGSTEDMTARIEAQIERFAPGFRDCILARHVSPPAALEAMDANLLGGDISGGALTLRQFFLRPTLRPYATGAAGIYLCSASTPPGAGVHGMCGYHAAKTALRHLRLA
jgi:phytoene dehydrogenase-like protein